MAAGISPYNLIVFGYLDSHTLFTSFSSLRLDNYVYTVESFREARSRLKKGGTLVVAFASGKSFVTARLFDTMSRAFEAPPRGYFTGYDGGGVVFVEGQGREGPPLQDFPQLNVRPETDKAKMLVATDRGRVVKLDLEGKVLEHWGSFGSYDGQFYWGHAVAVARNGDVYATDVHLGMRVQKFVRKPAR